MKNNLFRPFFNEKTDKLQFIKYNTIGNHKSHYFDYTASGLGFRQIENRVYDVLTTYANTHSKEAGMAATTSEHYADARDNLKKSLGLNDEFALIPNGCGATAAIKNFQELLGLYIPPATIKRFNITVAKKKLPLIIVGPYEHHSNEVSYREALCEIQRIRLNEEGLIDLKQLKEVLQENHHREIIGSFCVASNVTGIITPYEEISKLLRRYGATVCFDAAASSPYMNIPCELYDAMVMSPHKLLGGPGSCGILVIRKSLIDEEISPTFAGGGTVEYVSRTNQRYEKDIETRETPGTPGILQFIKASLAYQLRNELGFDWIVNNKEILTKRLIEGLSSIPECTVYGNTGEPNIGIVSFNIGEIDPYSLCQDLSQSFGVQTRAGCSCAGPYGHDLLGLQDQIALGERPGWVRISIHYSQTEQEIDSLLQSIKESISKSD